MIGLLELLDQLDARDIHVDVIAGPGPGPSLRTDAPAGSIDDDLGAAIRHHRDMLIAVVLGRRTGHAPGPCTICGRISMVNTSSSDGKPRTTWPACRYSSACSTSAGRHIPRDADIARTTPCAPPPEKRPPARPAHKRLLGPRPAWGDSPATRGV